MDIAQLKTFLLWCWLFNTGIYVLSGIAIVCMRGFLNRLHVKKFGITEETSNRVMVYYLSAYKLLITIFMFVPWLVLVIFF